MLPAIAEWNRAALSDEKAARVVILLHAGRSLDGFGLAKKFERDGWSADRQLVDVLDEFSCALSVAHRKAVQAWVVTTGVRPKLDLGVAVVVPSRTETDGEIVAINETDGTYTVRIRALGHVSEGPGTHGHIFAWEKLEELNELLHAD